MGKYFGCGGQQEITQRHIDVEHEVYAEHGEDYVLPDCNQCNKPLEVGDFIDGFHPYHVEYNCCKLCKPAMKDPSDYFNTPNNNTDSGVRRGLPLTE